MPKILIVDDSMFMRTLVKRAVSEGMGGTPFEFQEAGNGNEAVERYVQFRPDLVFMDISMPLVSGIDAVKEIRNFDPRARVVMVTAVNQEAMVADAVAAGAADFVVKPFKPEQLVAVVKKHIGL
ncbi:MAG: response regulator [Euryarchaeota archaeon]|nr:response regulator [Euryarchaeota archaeon]